MIKFAATAFSAATVFFFASAVTSDATAWGAAQSTSFVPRTGTHRHVYGAPIQPAVRAHTKRTPPQRYSKKPAGRAQTPHALSAHQDEVHGR